LITDDDRKIIESIIDGDAAKYEVIVKKYQIRIIHLCFKYTKNYSDAEEVAQEAFLKAYRSLETFRFDSKFYSWLHRISINCSLNYINSKEKLREKETISENSGLTNNEGETVDIVARLDQVGTETPYNSYNLEDMAKTIDIAYNNLPDDLKLVIKLRDIDDMTYDNIALETNLPIGTVRSKLHRARELLGKTIKKGFEDE